MEQDRGTRCPCKIANNHLNENSHLVVDNMSQSRWKGQFCKQNKLAKTANFFPKFKAKRAIEEQSQCLEESQNCFEAKLVKDLELFTRIF